MDDYMTLEETAAELEISPKTLRNHFATKSATFKVLRPFKVPGMKRWFVRRTAVAEALAQSQLQADGRLVRLGRKDK
ncbi:MAG TPA: hypothetical protein VGF29_06730 [Hyphomicrobiaceae bacterium]|jgi:hypothetical protein